MIKRHEFIMDWLLYEPHHMDIEDEIEFESNKDFACSFCELLCVKWGINVCSVESIMWTTLDDGQIVDIKINLLPSECNKAYDTRPKDMSNSKEVVINNEAVTNYVTDFQNDYLEFMTNTANYCDSDIDECVIECYDGSTTVYTSDIDEVTSWQK